MREKWGGFVGSVISLTVKRGFTHFRTISTRRNRKHENASTHRLKAEPNFLAQPGHYFMRTVLKVAFPFLILPISIMAQEHGAPDQYPPPAQSTGQQGFVAGSETPAPPNSTPTEIPVQVQTTPAFAYVRPSKQTPSFAAGSAPALNIGTGFSATGLGMPTSGHAVLGGVDLSVATDSGRRFGAKLDLNYQRVPNAFSTGQSMDVFSYLIGPVFYPSNGALLSTSVHLLGGGARVGGPFSSANGVVQLGHVNYPAWAIGGSVEYRLSPAFGFRVSVDYLRTHFFDVSGIIRGQNDLRIVNSLVYYFGRSTRKR
jgi:hypothetical protein